MQNNLTPTLTADQLKQNIDSMQSQNISSADIQTYVNNYKSDGAGGYTLATKGPGIFQSIVQGIAHPFLEAASSAKALYHGAAGLENSLEGNTSGAAAEEQDVNNLNNQGSNYGYLGNAKPIGAGFDVTKGIGANAIPLANSVGTGLELGSYALPVGEAGEIAGDVAKGGIGKAIMTGAKVGAGQGAVYGTGSALESSNPTVGGTAMGALGGTIAGGLTGGVLGGVGAAAAKPISIISSLLSKGVKQTGQDAAQDIIDNAIRSTAEKYPSTSGRVLANMENINKTDPIGVISSYGKGQALPTINEAGKVDSKEAVAFLQNKIGELSGIKNDVVAADPTTVKVSDFQNQAEALAKKQGWSQMKTDTAVAQIQKIFEGGMGGNDSGNLPLTEVDKIKTEQTGLSKAYNNPGKNAFELDAHGIIGKAARTIVEDSTNDAPTKELNKLIQSHYDAADLLTSLEGKAPHGGLLTKQIQRLAGETVGGIAGSLGGHPIIGAGVGRVAADTIDGIINNRFISNPLKSMLIKNMSDVPSDVVQRALQYINDTGAANASRLALPAAGGSTLDQTPITVYPSETKANLDYVGAKENPTIVAQRPESAASTEKNPSTTSTAIKTSIPKSIPEPYIADKDLPVIQMGNRANRPPAPGSDLPTIKGKANVPFLLGLAGTTGAGLAAAKASEPEIFNNPAYKDLKETQDIMGAIQTNETGGVKNPYSFKQPSGSKALGEALGAYQVTEGELKTYSKKFLGTQVTPAQFLASPVLQNKYMQAKVQSLKSRGLSDQEIIAHHRGGMGDLTPQGNAKVMKQYASYVDAATKTPSFMDLTSK